jgi:hypothetical protein
LQQKASDAKTSEAYWLGCDKIDVLLFNSKTHNSNDALRSKRHAVCQA